MVLQRLFPKHWLPVSEQLSIFAAAPGDNASARDSNSDGDKILIMIMLVYDDGDDDKTSDDDGSGDNYNGKQP